ncbi:DUF397 domain-containing protein [Verrucosispora sp. WMMD573]|uniref:DUF397 domain-containing protein n=1 Tax=Verrucosispora sp. WMMD573 TaxID=3015149 RepID=UPI00248CD04D|nr:DUF397 domain-containing protein [Verrucosispora sp. WMMD573]WBB54415.1 DUF397 domain-containing protein [Verrucosispora sp. WMMD573]
MLDQTGAVWRKSSRSNNGGNCVEVADNLAGSVGLRDSKNPSGPVLSVNARAWSAFVTGVKQGAFSN